MTATNLVAAGPRPLTEWELTTKPGQVAWLVMRIVKCRIHWWTGAIIEWSEDKGSAHVFPARDMGWDAARNLNGFLIVYDPQLRR